MEWNSSLNIPARGTDALVFTSRGHYWVASWYVDVWEVPGTHIKLTPFEVVAWQELPAPPIAPERQLGVQYLDIRTQNILQAARIYSVDQLAAMSEEAFASLPGVGKKTVADAKWALSQFGLEFGRS